MSGLMNVATAAAHAAGRLIMQSFDRLDRVKVQQKSAHDIVSSVDIAVESLIIQQIHKYYPGHAILSEEAGEVPCADVARHDPDWRWIIDPLDGTTNFINGVPHFSVSIAVQKLNKTVLGVVYDPFRDETFSAQIGEGALLNQKKLKLTSSKKVMMTDALIASGFPRKQSEHMALQFAMVQAVVNQSSGYRRMGSAALDLAYVAAGRWHALWDANLQPWDIAAGKLIALEAGAHYANFSTENLDMPFSSDFIMAANPRIMVALQNTLRNVIKQSN